MNANLLLTRAISLAADAYAGCSEPDGPPPVLHPLRVLLQCTDPIDRICAVLHDVAEIGDISTETLRSEGFPESVIGVVDCLTRRSDETFDDYIDRILKNKAACRVKLADLNDTIETLRLPEPHTADRGPLLRLRLAADRIADRLASAAQDAAGTAPAIRFRIGGCLMNGAEVVAYQLYAGVHVFYAGPATIASLSQEDLIDSERCEPYLEESLSQIRQEHGPCIDHRLQYALESSTAEHLREELTAINELPECFTFDYLYGSTILASVTLCLTKFALHADYSDEIKKPRFRTEYATIQKAAKSYAVFLDFICSYLDRKYMNSRNLIRKLWEENDRRAKKKQKGFILKLSETN